MFRLSAIVAAAALATSAQAATVTFQYGLPIVQSTTEINQTGLLSQFNPALGTLTGAVLNIFDAGTSTITLTNVAATTASARATAFSLISWRSALLPLDALLIDDDSLDYSTGAALSYAPGQSRSFGPLTDAGTFSYNLAGILASVTGVGTFPVNCQSESAITTIGGGGNINSTQVTTAGCGANITYTYTPRVVSVPEPTSLALTGLALLGLGAGVARRRKS